MDMINFIEKIKQFGMENVLRRYYSMYPAQVVDNEDEENRGRVKLKVPDILDDKELAEWAEPILRTAGLPKAPNIAELGTGGGVNTAEIAEATSSRTDGKFGSFFPPKIGDYVWVSFRMGDIRNPIYWEGGWWSEDEKPDYLSDDRKNALFISRFGHEITVDETQNAAKINIQTNTDYQIEIDETLQAEKITLKMGRSENIIQMSDENGNEYILIEDKNGDSWKWDVTNSQWEVNFEGDKTQVIKKTLTELVEEAVDQTYNDTLTQLIQKAVTQTFNDVLTQTIEKAVTQTFNDTLTQTIAKAVEQQFNATWKATIAETTEITTGTSVKLTQPKIAIGQGGVELLKAITDMQTALGTLQILTPVGPAAPMTASAAWPQVQAEIAKIISITGSL